MQEPTVNIRLPVRLWEIVRGQAEAERRSVTAQLVVLVEQVLKDRGALDPVPRRQGPRRTA